MLLKLASRWWIELMVGPGNVWDLNLRQGLAPGANFNSSLSTSDAVRRKTSWWPQNLCDRKQIWKKACSLCIHKKLQRTSQLSRHFGVYMMIGLQLAWIMKSHLFIKQKFNNWDFTWQVIMKTVFDRQRRTRLCVWLRKNQWFKFGNLYITVVGETYTGGGRK